MRLSSQFLCKNAFDFIGIENVGFYCNLSFVETVEIGFDIKWRMRKLHAVHLCRDYTFFRFVQVWMCSVTSTVSYIE